jgi:hypothetical protein
MGRTSGLNPAPEEPPILFEKSKLRHTGGSLKNEEPHNTNQIFFR